MWCTYIGIVCAHMGEHLCIVVRVSKYTSNGVSERVPGPSLNTPVSV